jgi:hypothetical protein
MNLIDLDEYEPHQKNIRREWPGLNESLVFINEALPLRECEECQVSHTRNYCGFHWPAPSLSSLSSKA